MEDLDTRTKTAGGSAEAGAVALSVHSPETSAKWVKKMRLPARSYLLGKFSCALVDKRKLPYHGVMCVFRECLTFYTRVFGTSRYIWSMESLSTVRKGRGLNLYVILQDGTELTFTSFNRKGRSRAAEMILNLINDKQTRMRQSRIGDEDGRDSEQENDNANEQDNDVSISQSAFADRKPARSQVEYQSNRTYPTGVAFKDKEFESDDISTSVSSRPIGGGKDSMMQSELEDDEMNDDGELDFVDFLPWIEEGDAVDVVIGKCFKERKQVASMQIPIDVQEIFAYVLLESDAWYREFHEEDTEVEVGAWEQVPGGYRERSTSFVKKLNYTIGPKQTKVNERSFLSFTSDGGFMLEIEGHNLDVPMGDSFRVESYLHFRPSGGKVTEAVACVAVNFLARNLFKSKIEAGTASETSVDYTELFKLFMTRTPPFIEKLWAEESQKLKASGVKRPSNVDSDISGSQEEEGNDEDDDEDNDGDDSEETTSGNDKLLWAGGDDVLDRYHNSTYPERTEVARDVMPCSVKVAYNALLLREGSLELYKRYFEGSGEHDWYLSEWTPKDGFQTRTLTYKKPLNMAMVNKITNCTETQWLSFTSSGGLLFESELYTPDVPSGDTFRVESFWEFSPYGDSETKIVASVAVRWLGKNMFKKMVEKGTKTDVTTSYSRLLAVAKQICTSFVENMSEASNRNKTSKKSSKKLQGKNDTFSNSTEREAKTLHRTQQRRRKSTVDSHQWLSTFLSLSLSRRQ